MSVTPQGPPPAGARPDGLYDTTSPSSTSKHAAEASSAVSATRTPGAGTDMFGATSGGDTSGFGGMVRREQARTSTERPFGGWFDEAYDVLVEAGLESAVTRVVVDRGELTLHVDPARTEDVCRALREGYPGFEDAVTRIVVDRGELTLHVLPDRTAEICQVLRDAADLRFELLSSLSGVDYPSQPDRLLVVYHLTSMTYRRRLRLETTCSLEDPHVRSVTGVYPTADFHERETWDMFGVQFDGHPALTRILMPDDWDGHPQRKDYPLGGVPVEYKGAQVPPPDERRSYA